MASSSSFFLLASFLLQAQWAAGQTVAAAPTASQSSNSAAQTSSTNSGTVDTNAGASGSDTSSFKLSQGGMIAIIVVVVVVAIAGIASTVLYVVAKRRQWNIRASISRASRRLTGKFDGSRAREAADRRSRRTGMIPGSGARVIRPPGQKRGFAINIDDVEKGYQTEPAKTKTSLGEKAWVQKLWGNDWK